ncbi:hypothetical protein QTG54_002548 [Skeletonema marinoi]|uniref:Uncharacterized protein n=1 Tax=Skeletonema marinoi TaxID=267567 RepID=A0AAD8YII4_9STRA|nr:hypothetical protein QTG54_002548 [Skeletonema marinoi]
MSEGTQAKTQTRVQDAGS